MDLASILTIGLSGLSYVVLDKDDLFTVFREEDAERERASREEPASGPDKAESTREGTSRSTLFRYPTESLWDSH